MGIRRRATLRTDRRSEPVKVGRHPLSLVAESACALSHGVSERNAELAL
jgi:hypothetical protein